MQWSDANESEIAAEWLAPQQRTVLTTVGESEATGLHRAGKPHYDIGQIKTILIPVLLLFGGNMKPLCKMIFILVVSIFLFSTGTVNSPAQPAKSMVKTIDIKSPAAEAEVALREVSDRRR